MGCDVINAWDDIKFAFFLLVHGGSFKLFVIARLLVCLCLLWDFQMFSWYTDYHRLATRKRAHSPVGKTSIGRISSFSTNILTVETHYWTCPSILAHHCEFIRS